MSWIKKLMNTFFDDDHDDDEVYYEEKEEQPKKQPAANKEISTPKVKRSEPLNRGVRKFAQNPNQQSAKMLHKYPENGAFRFPVIPDEKPGNATHYRNTYQQDKNYEKEQLRTEERITKSESRKAPSTPANPINKEPVKRPSFKPSHVPSPVYGFDKQKRTKPTADSKEASPEVKSRFTPTDVPSPVYGFGQRKPEGILFIGRDIPSSAPSIAKELLKSVDEILPNVQDEKEIVNNQYDLPLDEREAPFSDDTVYEHEELQEVQRFESMEEVSSTKQEIEQVEQPALEMEQVEKPVVHNEEISLETKEKNEVAIEEKKEEMMVKQEVHNPSISEETVHTENQDVRPVPALQKRDSVKPGGNYVPFNVLMLKKDRQTVSTQPKQVQKTERFSPVREQQPAVTPVQNAQKHERNLFVPLSFLNEATVSLQDDDIWLNEQKETLQSTLDNFNVNAKVVHMTKGPAVTRFEVQPAPGVKVNKVTNLTDDIKLSLAARDIRIEAPIPGKNAIGIEVPNQHSRAVYLREIIEHDVFKESASSLTVALGLDISGAPVVTDLQKMPHGLIAGATGSGKSVCINSILVSLLYKAKPDEVRLLLVDPKMVELAPYNHIPHLVTPVITDAKEATAALKWAVEEMERRYEEFAKTGVREIKRYNQKMEQERLYQNKMPYIVVVIDELADLMMVSPQEVEEAICRIAQKARACGIHLLLATQRPSVDVITGLIKANVPTRTAFAVSSAIDSRTILDMSGAERLLGRGDMLFMENGSNKAVRIQGTFVSDEEIEEVTRYVKEEYQTDYLFTREELIQHQQATEVEDELFEEACYYVIEVGAASSSSLQRRFRVGYNRAARLVDMMEGFGLVSPAMGSKPRHVLLTQEEFEDRLYSQVDS
ncbi:DNA translocase FtsK [Fictibacillus barbaricus]|uniref:S-DNA-T family DNA segregation ATPase FtsK/SpoIIIE n=1 Tax=Fictibacillus barbaricus TaxID=182136 RepID=A0ABU1U367_9BACL|nr:DNA translocase FtsK [Fictibacillus barbaricus]MDR7073821.1 S-DNA-T family DNA segregation ATPase FtsK/SpoIIIE [Fictibacillus barbaricus]